MNAIESLLHRIGWTKSKQSSSNEDIIISNELDPLLDWSNVLKEKRAEIIAF